MLNLKIRGMDESIKAEYSAEEIVFNYSYEYVEGDIIEISSEPNEFISVKLNLAMKESIIYIPEKVFRFTVPFGDKGEAYQAESWSGSNHLISAKVPPEPELYGYRNLALNSADYREGTGFYPHAYANFVSGDLAAYEARNAIDGEIKNDKHGRFPNHAYGGGKREDLEFFLDFGRRVKIDKIAFYLRADFPHDTYWKSMTIGFSDGSEIPISLKETGEPQLIKVDKVTENIRLKDFKQAANPLSFAALSEIEVYGTI